MLFPLLALCATLAIARPTQLTQRAAPNNGTLAPLAWINGEQISTVQTNAALGGSPRCTADDDILSCATKIVSTYQPPADSTTGENTVKVPWTAGPTGDFTQYPGGYALVKYKLAVDSCKLSEPQIMDKQPLFFCNADCKAHQSRDSPKEN